MPSKTTKNRYQQALASMQRRAELRAFDDARAKAIRGEGVQRVCDPCGTIFPGPPYPLPEDYGGDDSFLICKPCRNGGKARDPNGIWHKCLWCGQVFLGATPFHSPDEAARFCKTCSEWRKRIREGIARRPKKGGLHDPQRKRDRHPWRPAWKDGGK